MRVELSYQPGSCRSRESPSNLGRARAWWGEGPQELWRWEGQSASAPSDLAGKVTESWGCLLPDRILTTSLPPPRSVPEKIPWKPEDQPKAVGRGEMEDVVASKQQRRGQGWFSGTDAEDPAKMSHGFFCLRACFIFAFYLWCLGYTEVVCNFRKSKWLIFFLQASCFEVLLMSSLSAWYYVSINIAKFLVL